MYWKPADPSGQHSKQPQGIMPVLADISLSWCFLAPLHQRHRAAKWPCVAALITTTSSLLRYTRLALS